MTDERKEIEGIEALKNLTLPGDLGDPGEGQGDPGDQGPGADDPGGQGGAALNNIEVEVDSLLMMADGYCEMKGLSPLTALQRTFLRTGLIGVCKKYDLSLNLDEYPEITLTGGVLWVIADKATELRNKQKEQQAAEKDAA